MKKKKVATLIVSLALVATAITGATLAYLSAQTQTVENVFTVGNVSVDIEEPSWDPDDATELYVGAEVTKDPQITNIGKNDAYVVMQVSGVDEMSDFSVSYTDGNEVKTNWNSTDWSLLETVTDDGKVSYQVAENQPTELEDGYYVYNGVLTAGNNTTPLFTEVTFNGEEVATTYTIKGVDTDKDGKSNYYVINDGETQYTSQEAAQAAVTEMSNNDEVITFSLDVTGYAIQSDGFADQMTAITELLSDAQ